MIRLTIDGPIAHGPSWVALEPVIASLIGRPGRLTRIRRVDGGATYRAAWGAVYWLTWTPEQGGSETALELRVNYPERAGTDALADAGRWLERGRG